MAKKTNWKAKAIKLSLELGNAIGDANNLKAELVDIRAYYAGVVKEKDAKIVKANKRTQFLLNVFTAAVAEIG
jgi:hypothetical protein